MFNNEMQEKMGRAVNDALVKAGLPGSFLPQLASGIQSLRSSDYADPARLMELQNALKAMDSVMKGELGTLLQGQAFTGGVGGVGDLAPFVPQAMDTTVTVLGATMKQLWARKKIAKKSVKSIVYEDATTTRVGNPYASRWISEGGGGSLGRSTRQRGLVQVKQMCERREVTYLSTLVNMLGYQVPVVDQNALRVETYDGMQALEISIEDRTWRGDSEVHPLAFDGLYKQISGHTFVAGVPTVSNTSGNYIDKRGASVTGQELVGLLGYAFGGPFFASPGVCVMDPTLWGKLQQAGQDAVRFNSNGDAKMGSGSLAGFKFGAKEIWLTGPGGEVTVEAAPLIMGPERRFSYTAAEGAAAPVIGAFAITVGGGHIVVAPSATSKFVAADAGDYRYRIIAVGDKGVSAPLTVPTNGGAITVAAGDRVTFDIPDLAIQGDGNNEVRYYIVERTDLTGAIATSKIMWEYPTNGLGANNGNGTRIVDENLHIPGTAPVYLLSMDEEYLYWATLLETFQFPLPAVDTRLPFLLLNFGSPRVKAPIKQFMLDNVSLSI